MNCLIDLIAICVREYSDREESVYRGDGGMGDWSVGVLGHLFSVMSVITWCAIYVWLR